MNKGFALGCFVVIAFVIGQSCEVNPERQAPSSNKELKIEVVGTVEDCTIYRFVDGNTVHFVRCGPHTVTADTKTIPCGKGCVMVVTKNTDTQTIK